MACALCSQGVSGKLRLLHHVVSLSSVRLMILRLFQAIEQERGSALCYRGERGSALCYRGLEGEGVCSLYRGLEGEGVCSLL